MAGTLYVIALFLVIYTIFLPVLTLEKKHFWRGVLALLALGIFAFVVHVLKMM